MFGNLKIIFIALIVGFIVGAVFGYLMGKNVLLNGFQPLGKKRTATSFADRLYGEKFQYPPYLTPGTTYDLPMSAERNVTAFGNILTG